MNFDKLSYTKADTTRARGTLLHPPKIVAEPYYIPQIRGYVKVSHSCIPLQSFSRRFSWRAGPRLECNPEFRGFGIRGVNKGPGGLGSAKPEVWDLV